MMMIVSQYQSVAQCTMIAYHPCRCAPRGRAGTMRFVRYFPQQSHGRKVGVPRQNHITLMTTKILDQKG